MARCYKVYVGDKYAPQLVWSRKNQFQIWSLESAAQVGVSYLEGLQALKTLLQGLHTITIPFQTYPFALFCHESSATISTMEVCHTLLRICCETDYFCHLFKKLFPTKWSWILENQKRFLSNTDQRTKTSFNFCTSVIYWKSQMHLYSLFFRFWHFLF